MKRKQDICLTCGADIAGRHSNALRCRACATRKAKRPAHTLTTEQQARVKSAAGTVTVKELVQELGVTQANIRRYVRDVGLSLRVPVYSDELVRQVLEYYSEHGMGPTEQQFPTVRVRSIVEHRRRMHQVPPRQMRWTDDQILVLARMAGMVPYAKQAALLKRPRAYAGSVRAFWAKRMPCNATEMLGLTRRVARGICTPDVPYNKLKPKYREDAAYGLTIVLWCDAALYLRDDVPDFLRAAVEAMASFQCWLYDTETPQHAIHEIMDWGQSEEV